MSNTQLDFLYPLSTLAKKLLRAKPNFISVAAIFWHFSPTKSRFTVERSFIPCREIFRPFLPAKLLLSLEKLPTNAEQAFYRTRDHSDVSWQIASNLSKKMEPFATKKLWAALNAPLSITPRQFLSSDTQHTAKPKKLFASDLPSFSSNVTTEIGQNERLPTCSRAHSTLRRNPDVDVDVIKPSVDTQFGLFCESERSPGNFLARGCWMKRRRTWSWMRRMTQEGTP